MHDKMFFSRKEKGLWDTPEDTVKESLKWLSSEELLFIVKIRTFDPPNKKVGPISEKKMLQLSRLALTELCSRYSTNEDILNQRRGLLWCPKEAFTPHDKDVLTKALYDSMQHIEGRYPYKIQALFYLAEFNSQPININFQSDIDVLFDVSHTDVIELELLLPFFTEVQLHRLINDYSTYDMDEIDDQAALLSSTHCALALFSEDDISKLKAILHHPEHEKIRNLLRRAITPQKIEFKSDQINEIKKRLDDSNERALSDKVIMYAQTAQEFIDREYLNIFNTYTTLDKFSPIDHHTDALLLSNELIMCLNNKEVSNGLDKFVFKSADEFQQIYLEGIYEEISSRYSELNSYELSFFSFYVIQKWGKNNPDIIENIYKLAITKITELPYIERNLVYSLEIINNLAIFLTPEQVTQCCDLVWTMISLPAVPPETTSQLALNWYASFTANFTQSNPDTPLDQASIPLTYDFTLRRITQLFEISVERLAVIESNKIIETMLKLFEAGNVKKLRYALDKFPDETRSLFAKVSDTRTPDQVNALFDRIKRELQSDKFDNRLFALHIATAFKDKLYQKNLQYTLQSIKKMFHLANTPHLSLQDFPLLNNLSKLVPLFVKYKWVDAELLDLAFSHFNDLDDILSLEETSRNSLRKVFRQFVFMTNRYTDDVDSVLLPKYLQLLNSEPSVSYQRMIALESLLQLVLDHKVKHVSVSTHPDILSKMAHTIFPVLESLSELVQVKDDTKQETPGIGK